MYRNTEFAEKIPMPDDIRFIKNIGFTKIGEILRNLKENVRYDLSSPVYYNQ